MENLKDKAANNDSWRRRYNKQCKELVDSSVAVVSESGLPEVLSGVQRIIEIMDGKRKQCTEITNGGIKVKYPVLIGNMDEKPFWEARVSFARRDVYDIIDYLHSKRIDMPSRKTLEDDLINIIALGNEKRDIERKRTTKGRFLQYSQEVSACNQPEEFRQYYSKLADILQGNARDETTGKIVWLWKDRIKEVHKVLDEIEEKSMAAIRRGLISQDELKIMRIRAKEALDIGITGNVYVNNKYGSSKELDIYSPIERLRGQLGFSMHNENAIKQLQEKNIIQRFGVYMNSFNLPELPAIFRNLRSRFAEASSGVAGVFTSVAAYFSRT